MAEIISFPAGDKSHVEQRLPPQPLANGGGGPNNPTMDTRISILELRAEQANERMKRIESKIDANTEKLDNLPTKYDLKSNIQWIVGTSIGMLAIFIAILTYLQDQRISNKPEDKPVSAPVVQPIIIQVPTVPPPTVVAPAIAPTPQPASPRTPTANPKP